MAEIANEVRRGAGRPRTVARPIDTLVLNLQQAREDQGLSQTALAQRMGLETYGTISEHERGVNDPGLSLLRRWAGALGYEVVLSNRCAEEQARG